MLLAVLTFTDYWSDFIQPLLYLKSESRYTLPIGLRVLQQLDQTNRPLLMETWVDIEDPVGAELGRAFYGGVTVDQAIETAGSRTGEFFTPQAGVEAMR